MLSMTDLKEDKIEELIKLLETNGHKFESFYTDQTEFLEDVLSDVEFDGSPVPYVAEEGPSYSSGGQPAEGGYFEDITATLNGLDLTDFVTDSCLDNANDTLVDNY